MKQLCSTLLLATALLLSPLTGHAEERFLSYDSQIQIHPDGWLTVTETIRARAEGNKIKRGIYRSFPVIYKHRSGGRVRVPFEVVDTQRDGKPESHHIKTEGRFKNLYLGQSEVMLKPGEYTYRITYRTHRQLGFFDQHDELYWNVTGNEWDFPIDRITATVRLPEGAAPSSLGHEAYTGPEGAKGKDYQSRVEPDGSVRFESTRPLPVGEGLTLVVTWPKGLIPEPPASERIGGFLQDNGPVLAGLIGLALVTGYFLLVWMLVGRDPPSGVIIPLFEPPEALDPASGRYLLQMSFDKLCFTASVLGLAVKGFLTIQEEGGDYTLQKGRYTDRTELTDPERRAGKRLFLSGERLKLKQKNHSTLQTVIQGLEKDLKSAFHGSHFVANGRYFAFGFLGLVLTIAAVVYLAIRQGAGPEVIFLGIWLSIWTLGVVALLSTVAKLWRQVIRGGKKGSLAQAIFLSLFSLPFVGAEIGVGAFFLSRTSFWLLPILGIQLFLCIRFHHWLKRPTHRGRKLMDQIEGFRMYLGTAEAETLETADLLRRKDEPNPTPELFERYLPWALALGVDSAWAERFQEILARAAETEGGYQPSWYHGTSFHPATVGNFATNLGSSLSSAVSSASTAPGSSSGSGGGGSSGGGGGGGGGGGW